MSVNLFDGTFNRARTDMIAVGALGGIIQALLVVVSVGGDMLLAGRNHLLQVSLPQGCSRLCYPRLMLSLIFEGPLRRRFEILTDLLVHPFEFS